MQSENDQKRIVELETQLKYLLEEVKEQQEK